MIYSPLNEDKGGDVSSEGFFIICFLILVCCLIIAYFQGV